MYIYIYICISISIIKIEEYILNNIIKEIIILNLPDSRT